MGSGEGEDDNQVGIHFHESYTEPMGLQLAEWNARRFAANVNFASRGIFWQQPGKTN